MLCLYASFISITTVSTGPSPLTTLSPLVGSPVGSSVTSKPYSRIAPFSGLLPSAPASLAAYVIALSPSSPPPLSPALPSPWWHGCAAVPSLLYSGLLSRSFLVPVAAWVSGDFSPPPCPGLSPPGTMSPSGVTPEVSSPQGSLSTPEVSGLSSDSIPLPIP